MGGSTVVAGVSAAWVGLVAGVSAAWVGLVAGVSAAWVGLVAGVSAAWVGLVAVSTVLMIWVGSDGAQQSITDLHVEGNL